MKYLSIPPVERMLALVVVMGALLVGARASAYDPGSARYLLENDHVTWFLVTTDTHLGMDFLGGQKDSERLEWVLDEAYPVIMPAFVVVTGDLTDSTNGGLFPDGPHQEEWDQYKGITLGAGMGPGFYYDIPGNHDQYGDGQLEYYLDGSIQGSSTGQTQLAWTREYDFGSYVFVGACTTADDGLPWPMDNSFLDTEELAFIEDTLDEHVDYDLAFVFGHHPADRLGDSEDPFVSLMDSFGVSAYVYGHTHDFYEERIGDVFHYNLASLAKSGDDHVAVMAIDGNGVSTVAFEVSTWPVVLITAPVDEELGGDNPWTYPVASNFEANPVRALVFDAAPVDDVSFKVGASDWVEMYPVSTVLWEGHLDPEAIGIGPGEYILKVRSASPSGDYTDEIVFELASSDCSNGIDDDGNGATDYPDDSGCFSPMDPDESGGEPIEPPVDPGPEVVEPVETVDEIAVTELLEVVEETTMPADTTSDLTSTDGDEPPDDTSSTDTPPAPYHDTAPSPEISSDGLVTDGSSSSDAGDDTDDHDGSGHDDSAGCSTAAEVSPGAMLVLAILFVLLFTMRRRLLRR